MSNPTSRPKLTCGTTGSSHLAKYILGVIKHDSTKRAAVNLKFSDEALAVLEKRELEVSFYDRREEPEEIKRTEGMIIPWGVEQAIKRIGKVPDVVYHRGDVGKEPMIVIFGEQAYDLAKLTCSMVTKQINLSATNT